MFVLFTFHATAETPKFDLKTWLSTAFYFELEHETMKFRINTSILKTKIWDNFSEIRQEAVKAALASYPADQNQAIVPSSKRNTAYLLPLNNAPPVLAKEEEENTSDQINDLDNNKASVPFPVPIIETDPNNKPITKNSTKVIEDITGDVFSGRTNF